MVICKNLFKTLKMSAIFKNSKKKLAQSELRKYMHEHKGKAQKDVKKIESPLAKYNEQGQLTCVLCKSVVRSEAVWNVHVNAKQHKQNVELAKKLKERTKNFTTPLKRPLTPPMEVPEKKVKGILKNAKPTTSSTIESSNSKVNNIPEDFFDNSKPVKTPLRGANIKPAVEEMQVDESEVLPEGFFDDPKLDAKARNQEYKDPAEEEWEKFVKAIKEADNLSAAIIAEDQEESTTERQIDEIDEQMKKLSRVLDLEKKKEAMISISNESTSMEVNENEEDINENEFDEFLDWRAKKSFK